MANILFVEDDSELRELMERYLTKRGHAVQLAGDGLEALSVLDKNIGIEIMFTDGDMPNMNGFVLANTVRSDVKYECISKMPIIGVGTFSDMMSKPLTERLQKPYLPEDILRCIDHYCKR